MALSPSARLGPYEIVSPLGAGGMGEVYRARDSRLGREVAIKVLPEHLAGNPRALARFEREARAVAALSHPNILAIHDFGAQEGVVYAVTELLEGETLRARLERSPLGWRKAVEVGVALADGLAAAHAKDITHRDLKPENIFLTSDGRVKILDFGLARAGPATPDDQTEPGTVLGTVGYMSPEQVRGEPADARSDIFALGCVLYEMVAGQRAFRRPTAPETMTAILNDDPAPVGREVPPELDRVIAHCLEKSPPQRFQSAHDVAFALRAMREPAVAMPRPRRWVIRAVLALLPVAGFFYWLNRPAGAIDSLAVLPFVNAVGDPNAEYLSDGITENLINTLSQLPQLRVTARTLAFRYKGPQVDPQKAGRDLHVRAVLTGRVMERDGALNVQADLVNVDDGSQLWGRQYSRKFSDILTLQEEIAREVSEKLHLKPTVEQQKRLAKRSTENVEAYQLYLKGRYYWNRRTEQTLKRSVEYFQQAIDRDPGYALAYAGLADCYSVYSVYQVESPRESGPKAKAAATKALEIDDTVSEAHASLAYTKMHYERDWAGAEREFLRSNRTRPELSDSPSVV